MPRPKGSKNRKTLEREEAEAKASGSDTPAPASANGIGHNGPPPDKPAELTDEQKQTLALQHKHKLKALIEEKDSIVGKIRSAKKVIKADLGKDGVGLVEDMIKLETEEGEADMHARMERAMRAARYMATSLGTQFQLFEDRQPAAERAAAEGRRDGMAGKTLNPGEAGYQSGTPQYDAYANAWHGGQKALFAIQKMEDGALFDGAPSTEGPAPIGDQPETFTETVAA